MLPTIRKNGLILALFAVISTSVVSITHLLTKDTIQEQQAAQLQNLLNQVIPNQFHDNELYANCHSLSADEIGTNEVLPLYIATKDGNTTAVALEAIAPDGYNGSIKLLIGIDLDGNVLGVRVLSHQETPGLGDKIDLRVSDWILSFANKIINDNNSDLWHVRKDGGQFDQFTGATITPRAVVKAVYKAGLYFKQNQDNISANSPKCEVQ